MINIFICGFWDGFNNKRKKQLCNLLFNNNKYIICDNIDESNIIIVAPFINKIEYDFLLNDNNKLKFLFITEPIEHTRPNLYNLIKYNKYDLVFGCIENNFSKNFYKYPIYLRRIDIDDKLLFNNVNEYVKMTNLNEKKFCCLINTHDAGNTRRPIYKELSKLNIIDCPSKLLNNCSNDELNKIGNVKFLNKYLFNICSENFKCTLEGYITEKIMNCCLGGSIPIYYGSFDNIDEKIFNKNRIIFYDPTNENSLSKTCNFVRELLTDKTKLDFFYKQDVFCKNANEVIHELTSNLQNKIKELCDKLNK